MILLRRIKNFKSSKDAGAIVSIEKNYVTVTKNELKAFEFDATECPDLFPPLVALAVHCKGVSRDQRSFKIEAQGK